MQTQRETSARSAVTGPKRGRRGLMALIAARKGATAVELAMILPVFLSVILGIMEFGRLLWTKSALDYTVEEAARCAAINTTLCGTQALTRTWASARSGIAFDVNDFTLSTVACGTQVSATFPFGFVVPMFNYSVTLQASYCYPK